MPAGDLCFSGRSHRGILAGAALLPRCGRGRRKGCDGRAGVFRTAGREKALGNATRKVCFQKATYVGVWEDL